MRHILIGLTAFVLGLAVTIAVEAAGRSGGGGRPSSGGHPGGSGGHPGGSGGHPGGSGGHPGGSGGHPGGSGGRQNGGLRSRNFTGWTHGCVLADGSYGYYSPDDNTWYYWYGPDDAYRPVSDMASYPPDNSTPPMLPPGAKRLP